MLSPISPRLLVVPGVITAEEAIKAFDELLENGVILGNALKAPVNEGTVLSFLFPDIREPERKIKIAAIRSVLNDLSQQVELSVAVLVPALRAQIEGTFGQLGTLLAQFPRHGAGDRHRRARQGVSQCGYPRPAAHVRRRRQELTDPLVLSDRIAYLAQVLSLQTADLADAAAAPAAFGLTSLEDLSMKAVQAWSDYATLVALYPSEPEGPRNIAIYLTTGSVGALSKATGWDSAAFLALVTALWGKQIILTPSQLWLVSSCFALAGVMGTDVGSATDIARVSRLRPLSGATPPPAWATYGTAAAQSLVAMLRPSRRAAIGPRCTKSPSPMPRRPRRRDGPAPLAVWVNTGAPLGLATMRALSTNIC